MSKRLRTTKHSRSPRKIRVQSSWLAAFVVVIGVGAIGTYLLLRSFAANVPSSIRNGSFESTGSAWLSPWVFQVASDASGTIAQDGTTAADGRYSAKITVTRTSPTPFHVQLRQIYQVQNQGYLDTVQFWAKASSNRTITVTVQQAASPYTVYAQKAMALSTVWTPYSLAYQAPVSNSNVQVAFQAAVSLGSVWIDKTKFTNSNTSRAIYTGVSVPSNPGNLSQEINFENNATKGASIIMWYQHWGSTDGTQYFQPAWMNNVRAHGSIPEVTWMPWIGGGGVNQPAYSLNNIIAGRFDSYITSWATASKIWGHPYFLRFAHEMNGNWYPWSEQVNGNGSGQYARAWAHVHDIFTRVGATNATWVWSPNVDYGGSTSLRELYPGNGYVDWAGIDGYNWGTAQPGKSWLYFDGVIQQTYNDVLGITNKPLMVAETASTEHGGSKPDWITDTYAYKVPIYFPNIRAITWFDYNKETDWRIESSPQAQGAFASAIEEYLYKGNQYGNIAASPIPAP